MMRFAVMMCLALALCCCSHENRLRNGDLIFERAGQGRMSEAIDSATSHGDEAESFSHVAIVEVSGDSVYVIEAVPKHGVRRVTFDEYMADSADIVVMRLDGNYDASSFIENAKRFIGQPYDFWFMPDNGKMYCSELVYESYRDDCGEPIFETKPMNFRASDGSVPQYWVDLFDELGASIPHGVPGTNPNDMSRSPLLIPVNNY